MLPVRRLRVVNKMLALINLIKRDMKLYVRNRATVFFSLISMFIIIGLYALFLGDVQVEQMSAQFGHRGEVRWMINSWIMGGIIAVNAVNVTLLVLMTMVEDRDRGQIKDFLVAPLKKWQIIGGYLGASIILGIILSIISFGIAELYILLNGGELLSLMATIKVLIGIIASVISLSAFFLLVLLFVNSEKAGSAVTTIVGTLSGFLAGVYVPIGLMPDFIQNIMRTLPVNYSATMFKQIFVEEPNKLIFANSKDLLEYNTLMGNVIYINGQEVTYPFYILILLGSAVIFFIMALIKIKLDNK